MEVGEGRSQGQWPESEHLICTISSIVETNSGFPGPSLNPCGILFSIEGGSLRFIFSINLKKNTWISEYGRKNNGSCKMSLS